MHRDRVSILQFRSKIPWRSFLSENFVGARQMGHSEVKWFNFEVQTDYQRLNFAIFILK